MPKYRVNVTWTETVYYSAQHEVEAENEEEAGDIARDLDHYDCQEQDDSEHGCDTEYEIEEIEERPKKKRKAVAKRSLPAWF